MRAGKLNQRVLIQVPGNDQDAAGQPVEGWTNLITTGDGKVWASVDDVSGREFMAAGAEQARVTTTITMRYREGVRADMRVLHGSDVYRVIAPLAQGRVSLKLMCEKVSP
jgi:SPP1 family predicted phage head-tail adaptor